MRVHRNDNECNGNIGAHNVGQLLDVTNAISAHFYNQIACVKIRVEDGQWQSGLTVIGTLGATVGPCVANSCASASLVEVLPTEPVMPMTVVSELLLIFSTMEWANDPIATVASSTIISGSVSPRSSVVSRSAKLSLAPVRLAEL